MEKKNAINFLLYSLLGITLDSSEDELLDAAIKRAYQDASSHVLSIPDKAEKYWAKRIASDTIKKAIKTRIEGGQPYADWHEQLCKIDLKTVYKEKTTESGASDRPFSDGIAQKWVNMTVKYLCVMQTIFEQYGNGNTLKKLLGGIEQELHIPLDSFILEGISKELDLSLPRKEGKGEAGKYSPDKSLPWSKYDYKKHYAPLQLKLRDRINGPLLDWESSQWIKIAQIRRKKEQEAEEKKFGKNK